MNVICKGALVGGLAGVSLGGARAYQADDTVDVALKRAAAVGGAATGAGALVGLLLFRRNRRRLAVDRALASVLSPLGLNRKKHLSRRVRRQLRRLDVGKVDAAKLDLAALTGSARRRAGKAVDATRQRAADVGEIARQGTEQATDAVSHAVDVASHAVDVARQRAGGVAGQAAEVARRRAADVGEIARQGTEQATDAVSHAVDVARQRAGGVAGQAAEVARRRAADVGEIARQGTEQTTDAVSQAVDVTSHAVDVARHRSTNAAVQAVDTVSHAWEQAGDVADEVADAAQSLVDA